VCEDEEKGGNSRDIEGRRRKVIVVKSKASNCR
jgi:hypothetical protein